MALDWQSILTGGAGGVAVAAITSIKDLFGKWWEHHLALEKMKQEQKHKIEDEERAAKRKREDEATRLRLATDATRKRACADLTRIKNRIDLAEEWPELSGAFAQLDDFFTANPTLLRLESNKSFARTFLVKDAMRFRSSWPAILHKARSSLDLLVVPETEELEALGASTAITKPTPVGTDTPS